MNFNIIMTSKCNLRCNYCYEGSNKLQKDMNIITANKVVEFIIDTLSKRNELNRRNKVIFHGGEPMMNYKVIKIIKYRLDKELDKKYIIDYMTTINGTILNSEIVEFIKENNIGLSISIDGTKEVHNQNRIYNDGTGSYEEMVKNLGILKKSGIIPRARMTYRSSNVLSFYDSIVNIASLGFEVCVPVADFYDREWSDDKIEILQSQINKIIKDENLKDIRISIVNKETLCRTRSDCFGGVTTVTISENGELYPCVFTIGEPKFIIGNVIDGEGIKKDKVDIIFKEIISEPDSCHGCQAKELCFGNQCKLLNYMVTKKYNMAPSINCRLMGVELNTYEKLHKGDDRN